MEFVKLEKPIRSIKINNPIDADDNESVSSDISDTSDVSDFYVETANYEEEEEDPLNMIFTKGKTYEQMMKRYKLAKDSYKEIYEMSNSRGKTKLKPVSMMGKPIQLDLNNLNTLADHKYGVSTKADGLRYFMMISNDFMVDILVQENPKVYKKEQRRSIFFVDSNLDFWEFRNGSKTLNDVSNIAQCLIDGEIYLDGYEYYSDDKVTKYVPIKRKEQTATAIFIAFDILYGPYSPAFEDEKADDEEETKFTKVEIVGRPQLVPGPSAPFVGFKAIERWPTHNRRFVLNTVFNNEKSPIISQLQDISRYFNFTMVVSPFVNLDTVLSHEDYYGYMRQVFQKELEKQYFRNTGKKMPIIKTDGLIFTPLFMPYVYDTWSTCTNKQYKWKPKNKLTIDFEIHSNKKIIVNDRPYYFGLVSSKDRNNEYKPVEFVYKEDTGAKKALISVPSEFSQKVSTILDTKKTIIVECEKTNKYINDETLEKDAIYFTVSKIRADKERANAGRTATSVLDADKLPIDIFENLRLLKSLNVTKNTVMSDESRINNFKKYLNNSLMFLNKNSIINLFVQNNIYEILTKEQRQKMKVMLVKLFKNSNNVLELETRIVFVNNCSFYLLKESIGNVEKQVSVTSYRYHANVNGADARLTCIDIDDVPEPYSINYKNNISSMNIDLKKYFKDIKKFDIVLSNEEERPLNEHEKQIVYKAVDSAVAKKAKPINYQSRVFISNISMFWEIEIIEYSSGNTPEEAKENYMSGPKSSYNKYGYSTRIEIEFKPLANITNFLDLYSINYAEKNEYQYKKADKELQYYLDPYGENKATGYDERFKWYLNKVNLLKERVKYVDPDYIIDDYMRVLKFIFRIFYN